MDYTHPIIHVDDEPLIRNIIYEFLKALNYQNYDSVETPEQAISLFNKYRSDYGKTPLVITDYNMPLKNGVELARYFKKIEPSTCIVLLTALSHYAVDDEGFDEKLFEDILCKPIQIAQLKNCIEKIINDS